MQTSSNTSRRTDTNWTLKELRSRVPGVEHVVAVSADGLLIGDTETMPRDAAERTAATASGLQSLANGAAKLKRIIDGNPTEASYSPLVIIELSDGFMYVRQGAKGTLLAVLTGQDNVDAGLLDAELNALVDKLGSYLATEERSSGSAG